MTKHQFNALFFFMILCVSVSSVAEQRRDKHFTRSEYDQAINSMAQYMRYSVNKNGAFTYRINTNPSVEVKPKYNMLRHAGAIYAMVMHYRLWPDPEMLSAIKKAATYLKNQAIGPLPDNNDLFAVWSFPEITGTMNPVQAKLGGAGLGLVALVSIESIEPGFTSREVLHKLANFIVFSQKASGEFYSKYIPSRGGRTDRWKSLFYPGEAALGLLMLDEKYPSEKWAKKAYKALRYLAVQRKDATNIPSDHWALLATEKMLTAAPAHKTLTIDGALLINHARQICHSILSDQVTASHHQAFVGGFSPDGGTTPTATRLEGLLAALNFISVDDPLHQQIQQAVVMGINFLFDAYIKDGEFEGGVPRTIEKTVASGESGLPFNERATEIRIDYVQHALSAFIQYRFLLGGLRNIETGS